MPISPSLVGLLFSSKTSVQMMFSFLLRLCLASEASDEEEFADDEWPEVKLPFVWGILNDSYPQKNWCHTIPEAVGRQVILEYSHHDEYAWASKGLRFHPPLTHWMMIRAAAGKNTDMREETLSQIWCFKVEEVTEA